MLVVVHDVLLKTLFKESEKSGSLLICSRREVNLMISSDNEAVA